MNNKLLSSCKQSLQRFAQDDRLFTSAALRLPMIDIVSAAIIQTQIRVPRPSKKGPFLGPFWTPQKGGFGALFGPPGRGRKRPKKADFPEIRDFGGKFVHAPYQRAKESVPTGRVIKYPPKCATWGPPGGAPPGPPSGGVPDRWFGAPKRGPQNAGFWRGPGDPSPRFQTRMRQSPSYGSLLAHLVPEELEEREQRSMR